MARPDLPPDGKDTPPPGGPGSTAPTGGSSPVASPLPPPRPPVALVPGSGSDLESEVRRLLYRRARIALGLLTTGFGFFLARDVWDDGWELLDYQLDFALQATALVLAAAFSVLLWRRPGIGLRSLRRVELVMLAAVVAQFAYTQQRALVFDRKWLARQGPDGPWLGAWDGDILLMSVDSCMLRWFALLVGYGTFFPNTGRRCAMVVGAVALCPVAQLAGTALAQHDLGLYAQGLAVATVWSASGAAIAVYGSYRINDLRRKAFGARRLGPYRLRHRLGAGGMGEVHLAEHVLLRRACAVKLIRPDRGGPDARARFEREVQATAALTHPNTVEVYDYGQAEDGTFYYVMEYLPGLTLQELVDRCGPLSFGRAVHLLRQVCSALREAHGRGLIHRDIKPGNVIACERGGLADVVKLLDFGLVRVFGPGADDDRLTREGMITGTPAYLSPEQATGGVRVNARSDLYAVGAVAYFLLAGRPPFVHANWVQTVHAHAYERPPPLSGFRADVPPDLAAAVVRCLEKDPAARFADAAALEAALAGCACAADWTTEDAAAWWAARPTPGAVPAPYAATGPDSTLRTGRPTG